MPRVGDRELAELGHAPVNAPFSWPNSSRLEQRLGNRRAVDGDERLVGVGRVEVDGAGDEFLPVPLSPRMSTGARDRETCPINL